MKKMNKKGFTLIEMLAVIAIIAVLVAIIVPAVSGSTTKAKAAADAANLRSVQAEAAIDYLEDNDLDKTYTCDIKSVSGTSVEIHKVGDNLDAVAVASSSYYDADSFAAVASAGGEVTASAKAFSATTKIAYPAAG